MTQRSTPNPAVAGATLRQLRETAGLSQEDLAKATGWTAKTIYRWEHGMAAPREVVLTYLRTRLEGPQKVREERPQFKFIDLFAGIGGLRVGFESVGGECVFTSEWDKYAQATYLANFGNRHPIAGDIRGVPSEHIPSHDVLLAGFPCQPFSIAGVSKKNALGRPHGFACETQGTLFFEVARILRDHRPKAFLLENVKNLKTHDRGNTFRVIMNTLREELGYQVYSHVLDSKGVVPQHRERVFIVGFRDPVDFSWEDVDLPSAEDGPRLRSILHPEDGSEASDPRFIDSKGRVLPKYMLTDKLWEYLQDYAKKHRSKGNGFGYGLVGPDDVARTLSARYYKDGSEILVRRRRGNPRRLTPRECSHLMGFDRPGRRQFEIPVSDTQAYKQFGNAVVVPVVESVARLMRPALVGEAAQREQLSLRLMRSA